LKVSFALAGSPYHIGAAVVDWNPCDRGSATSIANGASPYVGVQRRHVILTPDNSYMELAIPHYSDTPYEIGSAAAGANKGNLSFRPLLALLRCDGTAPGGITVTVRAWTEDMVLCEPSFIQTMKSMKGDSYETTATQDVNTAANGAAAFTRLAGRVGQRLETMAAKLGLTVKSDNNAMAMVPKSTTQFATVDGKRPVDTLTAYETNYITPMEDGSGLGDQITIGSLTSRRGMLIALSNYDTTSTVGDVLFNLPVTPMLAAGAGPYLPTPLAMASALFMKWAGSLAFTITVYSSPLQQGAILIAHEPCSTAPTSANNTQAAATVKACVLDLATSKKKTVLVSSVGGTNELLNVKPTFNGITAPANCFIAYSGTAVAGTSAGYLTISVNKPLIAPGASKVFITIEVAAGPDFQLFDYNTEHIDRYTMSMLSIESPSVDHDETQCDLRYKVYSNVRKVHAGEEIVSFRAMLNRPHVVQFAPMTQKLAGATLAVQYRTVNYMRNLKFSTFRNEAQISALAARAPVTDLVNWISSMFARRTGGMRYNFAISYRPTTNAPQFASVFRSSEGMDATDSVYPNTYFQDLSSVSGSLGTTTYPNGTYASAFWNVLGAGSTLVDLRLNSVLSVEDTPVTNSPFVDDYSYLGIWLSMRDVYAIDTSILTYRYAKPDLNFYEFVGCPVMTTRTQNNLTLSAVANADGSIS